MERISRLIKDSLLNFLKLKSYLTCESCLQDKMTKLSFTQKGTRCINTLDSIHNDVCGPINHVEICDFVYVISFIDDCLRYQHIYHIKHKSEAFEKFQVFDVEFKK